MGFRETINLILEPIVVDGKTYYPDIFYDGGVRQDFDAPRTGRIHNGVDLNYRDEIGNRAPLINDLHPDVNSPVSGIVTDVNEKWGIIEITDAYENKHRICHLYNWDTTWKDKLNNGEVIEITAGQTIGKMGGRGDKNEDGIYGEEEYRPHVDYKIIGKDGRYRDPEDYWNYSWESFMLKYYEGLTQKYGFFTSAAATLPLKFDPLIIDLDGDGIETVASTDGAYFDHDGNGFAERTGWVSANDGILVMDRDGDGRISSGRELFGDQTVMSNGERAAGAFEALADLDNNSDGRIDANDAAFSQIKVWQDFDGDGYSTADELKPLSELGISALNTGYAEVSRPDGQGNTQIQAGTFDKTDDTTGQAGGFLLQRDTTYTIAEEWLDVPADIAVLPDLQGYGNVYDLHQAMVRDTGGELKALVESFIAATDIVERNDLMDQILFKWTGTENLSPSSRGPNIDARRLETLEKLFGQTFIGVDSSENPNGSAADLLNQSYQGMFEMYYAQLMAQTHMQELYGAITYSWDETTQSVKGDLTPVLAEIQNSAALGRDACQLVVVEFMRTIKGMQAQDMLNIGAFSDAVSAWDKEFGSLVDSINANLLYGNSVEDSLFGGAGSDVIVGFQGADFILGYEDDDVLIGGSGDDTLLGYEGDDTLIGNSGNDSLYGENGNDLIDGGGGDDYLDGGSGDDVFVYGRGSGNDTIQRYSPWSGNYNGIDTVRFGEGLTVDSFDYIGKGMNEGGDLIFRIKDTGETLTIKNWFVYDEYKVDRFLFADGTEIASAEISERAVIIITGTEGDDILDGVSVPDYNNTLFGLGGNDYLSGGNRDDILDGGSGDDALSGWSGNDILLGGEGGDIVSGGSGNDVIEGNDGNDSLYGENGNDLIDGGGGDDYLDGGSGDDVFVYGRGSGNDVIQRVFNWWSNENGIDTVQFSEGLAADSFDYTGKGLNEGGDLILRIKNTGETLTIKNWFVEDQYRVDRFLFTGGTELTSEEISSRTEIIPIIGTEEDDILNGVAVPDHNNALYGLGGNDNLLGENRDDLLDGGSGDDTLSGCDGNDTLIGGEGNDYLFGYDGNDLLDGGPGNDYMSGSSGDDVLYGDAGNDTLYGENGNDLIDGGSGDDYLDGGSGDDVFVYGRGSGNDVIQRVFNWWSNENGIDTVQFSEGLAADSFDYTGKGLNEGGDLILRIKDTDETLTIKSWFIEDQYRVDRFLFTGGTELTSEEISSRAEILPIVGTEEDDILNGVAVPDHNNNLYGLGGNDNLLGGNRDDLLDGGSGDDTLSGWDGNDTLIGGEGNDYLYGYDGNDVLDGGPGKDYMSGCSGDDNYIIDCTSDIIDEAANDGIDTVLSPITYILGSNLENLTLTGSAKINGTGNELDNIIIGNIANNILNGGTGNDTLIGGLGNDTFVVNNVSDIVMESPGEGTDIVKSSVTYILDANIENLTLTGSSAINGTGNDLNNTLTGNSSVNILTGGAGNDTLNGGIGADNLIGGIGNDTYVVDNTGDTVTENINEGTDIVKSSVNYTLGANIEKLTLTGSSAINGTGNELNNVLTGNGAINTLIGGAGNDTIDGKAGTDTMVGGIGNDTYVVDNTGDIITENANAGTDTVKSSVTFTLSANLENLTLTGNSAINGTGNELNNVITGNTGANILDGNGGNDTLAGGYGSDTYIFRRTDGKDIIKETAGIAGDSDTVKMTNGISAEEPVIVKQKNDLYLFADSNNYVRVTNQFYQPNYGVERLEVTDGYYITRADIENIVNTMSVINNDPGMDIIQKFNAIRNDQTYIDTLAQSWHQPEI